MVFMDVTKGLPDLIDKQKLSDYGGSCAMINGTDCYVCCGRLALEQKGSS